MATVFVIEDEFHAEWQGGHYASLRDALEELKRRAVLPWEEVPNRWPCTSWKTCHRDYNILEYDNSSTPWRELRRLGYLEVSSKGAVWSGDFENGHMREHA